MPTLLRVAPHGETLCFAVTSHLASLILNKPNRIFREKDASNDTLITTNGTKRDSIGNRDNDALLNAICAYFEMIFVPTLRSTIIKLINFLFLYVVLYISIQL